MPKPIYHVSFLLAFVFACAAVAPEKSFATELSPKYKDTCDRVTQIAARETNVPLKVLKAIARTESGISIADDFVPWPWTLNVEGKGVRLPSRVEALNAFRKTRESGVQNVDVGCFQVNYRWHGSNFPSVEDMLDPLSNALYAARFLKTLYQEFGDWISAAGAYHSRNQEFSQLYLSRLLPIMAKIDTSQTFAENRVTNSAPENTFPLLHGASQSTSRGSLFPTITTKKRSLLGGAGPRG